MSQLGFAYIARRCTGCKTCVLACKDYHDLGSGIAYRQVYEYGGGTWVRHSNGSWSTDTQAYYLSLSCNHCTQGICLEVCPTGAMHKDEYGLVQVDVGRCIGCGYCELSCPYRAPRVDRKAGHSVKCDGCASRLNQGLRPICVDACSLRAIEFGEIDELRRKHGDSQDLDMLPDPSETAPNLVIVPPACVDDEGRLTCGRGRVINTLDIV